MFRNARNNRCKSAKMMRCRENKLHVVELTLADIQPVNTSLPAKLESYIRQQENCHRPGNGFREVFIDDVKTLPHYPSDNALNIEGEVYEGQLQSTDILCNQRKSLRNSRYQVVSQEGDNNRTGRPYRPISSHQYLTSTELKDTALQDKNVHLGRPTRTTLLRERQRRRSVTAVDAFHHQQLKAGNQKLDPRTPTRYEAVTNILYSMIPPGQSLHSFLSGARYNRSNWIETMGSLDLASDLPAMSGLSSNTQNQRSMSVQLDADYLPRAPPDSPVDFMNTAAKDESTGVFLPSLSGSGTAEPISPSTKQMPENRSRKIAWEEEIMRLSPLPDRSASTQEKVRFYTDEPVAGGNVNVAHHERMHHIVRPASVRVPASQPSKHGRDMASVVVHGVSLHGSCVPSARDASFPQAPAEQPLDGMRRSWSATSYLASGSRPAMEFNRLDPLKVTGVKVSGATDTGTAGLRLSAVKPWRLENDAESTEVMVGSRCEDQEAGTEECTVAAASDRSNHNQEADHEIDSSIDVDHEIKFNSDADQEIDSDKEVHHEIDSSVEIDHEIEPHRELYHRIDSNTEADHVMERSVEVDHEIRSSKEVDHEILQNRDTDRSRMDGCDNDSEITDASILGNDQDEPHPSKVEIQCPSTDQQSETDDSIQSDQIEIQSDQIDLADEPSEQIPDNPHNALEKQGQVNLPIQSTEQGNVNLPEKSQVGMDSVLEEPDQISTNYQSAKQARVVALDKLTELGQVSDLKESAEEADFPEESENLGQVRQTYDGQNSGSEKKLEGVVFFITEEKANNLEKAVRGPHGKQINEDEKDDNEDEKGDNEEEEEEQLHCDGTAKDTVIDTTIFDEERSTGYSDIVVSERSDILPDSETAEGHGHGQSVVSTNRSLDGERQ